NEVSSLGLGVAHGNIGLSTRKVEQTLLRDDLELDLRIDASKFREPRCDHICRDVVGGGDPYFAEYANVATKRLAFERKDRFLGRLGFRADSFPAVGKNISGLPALEEP